MFKNVIPAIMFFSSLTALADDYIVNLKNDTLRGKVSILTYGTMDRAQVIGADKKKTTLTAIQLLAVSFNNEIYNPVRTNFGYRMMKLVRPGFVALYLGRRTTGPSDTGFYYDVQFLVKRDGNSIEVPNLSFKKTMTNFLDECADIKTKIEKEDLRRADLDKILSEYNNCIEEQTRQSKSKTALETDNPKIAQLNDFKAKVEASSLSGKKDALEILNDVVSKVQQRQSVPNYLVDGLKNILKESPELAGEFDKIASSLNQP